MTTRHLASAAALAALLVALLFSACASPKRAAVRITVQPATATPTPATTATPTPTVTPTSVTPPATPTSTTPTATPTPLITPAATPTPVLTAPATSGGIYAVGDSVMLGASSALAAYGITVAAQESHSWDWGVSVVQGWVASGAAPSILVVHLGNNSAVSTAQFDAMMSAARTTAQVYFVTVYEPSLVAHQSEVNGVLAAGVGRYPNAHLIDWAKVASQSVCSDGIHISCGGAAAYVQLILSSI